MKSSKKEVFFSRDEFIVSKTNLKGHLTYTNEVFINISGYTEDELIGAPHSILRNPDMPRCIFKLLWDFISNGKEVFAYVVNETKNGDYYWVFAHVTPSFDGDGNVVGYHSNRRVPDKRIVQEIIIPLYKQLLDEEKTYKSRKDGMNASFNTLQNIFKEKGMDYNEFIFSL